MNIIHFLQRIRTSESKKAEAIRFAIIGGLATVLQYVFYLVFLKLCSFSPEISLIISYGLSFCFNFFLSNYFTFRTKPNVKKSGSFAASHLINLGLQTLFVWLFSKMMNPAYALLPAMAICVPINFFLVRIALKARIFQSGRRAA